MALPEVERWGGFPLEVLIAFKLEIMDSPLIAMIAMIQIQFNSTKVAFLYYKRIQKMHSWGVKEEKCSGVAKRLDFPEAYWNTRWLNVNTSDIL